MGFHGTVSAHPDGKNFEFPKEIPCSSLVRFLASFPWSGAGEDQVSMVVFDHVRGNLYCAFKQIQDFGLDAFKNSIARNVDADPFQQPSMLDAESLPRPLDQQTPAPNHHQGDVARSGH